jgi:hypothetical protein
MLQQKTKKLEEMRNSLDSSQQQAGNPFRPFYFSDKVFRAC